MVHRSAATATSGASGSAMSSLYAASDSQLASAANASLQPTPLCLALPCAQLGVCSPPSRLQPPPGRQRLRRGTLGCAARWATRPNADKAQPHPMATACLTTQWPSLASRSSPAPPRGLVSRCTVPTSTSMLRCVGCHASRGSGPMHGHAPGLDVGHVTRRR